MNLFNRFIGWLAEGIKPPPIKLTTRNGRVVSRVHAVQLKRQKANKRLHRWWRWYRFWR